MLGVGALEVALVIVVALAALGPEKLRSAAQSAGRLAKGARRNLDAIRDDLDIFRERSATQSDERSDEGT